MEVAQPRWYHGWAREVDGKGRKYAVAGSGAGMAYGGRDGAEAQLHNGAVGHQWQQEFSFV
jgi:hypothetical protein